MRRIAILTLIGALVQTAPAQVRLDWYTTDGGGGTCTRGTYSLSGTMGQPDAGALAGVRGGLWPAADVPVLCVGNLNGDGEVDIGDVASLQAHFGATCDQTRARLDVRLSWLKFDRLRASSDFGPLF